MTAGAPPRNDLATARVPLASIATQIGCCAPHAVARSIRRLPDARLIALSRKVCAAPTNLSSCGIRSLAAAPRAVAQQRLAPFRLKAVSPQIDSVAAHAETTGHFAGGEALAEQEHDAAS